MGLTTLDCIYRVEQVPTADEKVVAQDNLMVAGGPATNAAVMFRHLGNEAIVLSALGQHPVTSLIRSDLKKQGVNHIDLLPDKASSPPLSTIMVTAATGERAVVSRNAVDLQGAAPDDVTPWLEGIDVVLVDGHQMELGQSIAEGARQRHIPVVVDAGSWKPGFDAVFSQSTSVIAASKFRLPGQTTPEQTLFTLHKMGMVEGAMTFGPDPIQWFAEHARGHIAVPQVAVQDTLGAGDMLHGAFCHYRLLLDFPPALLAAAEQAAHMCQFFGPREGLLNQRTN